MKTIRKSSPQISPSRQGTHAIAEPGLPHPAQELIKARMILEIAALLKSLNLTQTEAAKLLGVQQPLISALTRHRAGSFSIGRLMEFLNVLGQDVEITVRPKQKKVGEMWVVFE